MMKTNELKPVFQMERNEKIDLLNRIKSGEITPDQLNTESIIVSDGQQAFTGLLVAVARKENPGNVVFIGEARKVMLKSLETILEKRQEKTK